MTYNVKKKKKLQSGLSFANDSIQTDDRGKGGVRPTTISSTY